MPTTVINLKEPKVEGNKITFSWDNEQFLNGSSYTIEYLGLSEIKASPQMLMETYFPICLAFSALGDVEINFPQPFDRSVLTHWQKVLKDSSRKLYKRPCNVTFKNTIDNKGQLQNSTGSNTALLFGGGSESLLTLAYFLENKITPILISVWGNDDWPGSDLKLNQDRYKLEELLCKEYGLKNSQDQNRYKKSL